MPNIRDMHLGQMSVVEVRSSHAGALAGKFAADLGARVEVLLLDGGLPSDAWLDHGKRTTHIEHERLAEEVIARATDADVLLWDDTYGRLAPMATAARQKFAYTLELAGSFVSHGPWSEVTLLAEAGIAYLTGRPDGPPIPLPGHQVAMLMGCHGFGAIGSAIANATAGGPAAHVSIAAVEFLAGLHQFSLIDFVCNGRVRRRNGRRWANNHPIGCPTACKDGHVAVCPATDEQFLRLCVLLEQPELAEDPRFLTTTLRFEHADDIDAVMEEYFGRHTREELFSVANELGAPLAPVLDPDEILADRNLELRGFWEERDGVRFPKTGVRALPDCTVIKPPRDVPSKPLEGIRVVEFTKVWAGPLAGRALADLGAEVVKIEAPFSRGPASIPPGAAVKPAIYPDDDPGERPWNRQGIQNILNRSRKSVCLDIKDPRAREITFELCARADVVLDNNRPFALSRSGLGYEAIAERNPGIILVGMSGYGAESIYRDYPAYGPVTEAMGGLVWWIRDASFPDIPLPTGMGFPDPIIAAMATARVAAALNERRATGRGQFIDLSQVESTVAFLGDLLVRWQSAPDGGRDWRMAFDPNDRTIQMPGGRYLVMTLPGGEPAEALPAEPHHLREQGVAAAWDNAAPEVLASPELVDFWVDFDHPDVGQYRYDNNPYRVATGRLPARIFPSLGQDNTEVLMSWLGLSESEAASLQAAGVLNTSPRLPLTAPPL